MKLRALLLITLAGTAFGLARGPAWAQQEPAPPEPAATETLAFELSQLAEVWVHGDDAQAAARLDTFRNDNRLRGELPRWVASMRAALALDNHDSQTALTALRPLLQDAHDARPFLRASRLLLVLGAEKDALAVIRQGRSLDPASPALRRFEAGLLWLGSDYIAAQQAYLDLIADDAREDYPYVTPNFGDWRNVKPWGELAAAPPAPPAAGGRGFDDGWDEPAPGPGAWQPEPFADLFLPATWYTSDLPGLDRCLAEMATDPDMVSRARAAFPARHQAALDAQHAFESFRGGDAQERTRLGRESRLQRWTALLACRVCAQADIAAGKPADAETLLRMGLELSQDDTAVLDMMVRAQAAQGKAEEARTGALARLVSRGLTVWSSMMLARGPQQQIVDRVLEAAYKLYKTNPQAGLLQLEAVRKAFGPEHQNREIPQDCMGIWLYLRGEKELALKYLAEAGRQRGYESGRSLSQDGILLESALLALAAPAGPAAAAPADPDAKPADPKPDNGDKPAGEKPAEEENSTDPLALRVLPRAGLLLGSMPDSRTVFWKLVNMELWGGTSGVVQHARAAQILPEGDKRLRELLFGYQVRLASELTEAQLDAALAPAHPASKQLEDALKGFGEGLEQARTGNNWRAVQALRERAGFVLGLVEARALLLRASLRQKQPKDMAALQKWLAAAQGSIDLRAQFKSTLTDAQAKQSEDRAKAGIPEVLHAGLLLDCAKLLARNGDAAGAANLLWFNRDVALGVDSRQRRLFLASVLARKAGDALLQAQCRLAALEPADNRREQPDNMLLLYELPQLKGEFEEFGTKADLVDFAENCLVPWMDSPMLAAAYQFAPELRAARSSMLMRNTLRAGTDGIFRAGLSEASVSTIDQNWLKMLANREGHAKCRRFALWVLGSDLPFSRGRGASSGLNSVQDTVHGWALLQQLEEARSAYEPKAKVESDRLLKLLSRCNTPADDASSYEEEWWD
ncbi:MAG: hypothetical protein IPP14_08740 [Planctomycetes bacterium]|nr:hypothetical protein [Planctomycetota bacterium]